MKQKPDPLPEAARWPFPTVEDERRRAWRIAASCPARLLRSEWIDGKHVPWETGVYECEWPHAEMGGTSVYYNHWSGKHWHWGSRNLLDASDLFRSSPKTKGRLTPARWRGINESEARRLGMVA